MSLLIMIGVIYLGASLIVTAILVSIFAVSGRDHQSAMEESRETAASSVPAMQASHQQPHPQHTHP